MALVIGTVLGVINHYDMFVTGDFMPRRIIQFLITYFVPFSVSLYSSAMTGRYHEKKSMRTK